MPRALWNCRHGHLYSKVEANIKQDGQAIYTFSKVRWSKNMQLAYRCSKFNACCMLSCRANSKLNSCLCRPIMTLNQGPGHRHERVQISHAYVWRHTRLECHSLDAVRDMVIIVRVKHSSSLRRNCDLEWRANYAIGLITYYFVGLYLHSKRDGDCMSSFWYTRTVIIFTIKSCVTGRKGQGQYN